MGKVAFLFPGQGSQAVGMGQALIDSSPEAAAVFERANSALDDDLKKVILEGPEGDLKRTANTQPAILTASIAALRALEAAGVPAPDFAAGHSLGEYSALVAAGTLSFEDAVKSVRARGTFMQVAVPEGVGAMAAILGLDADKISEVCASLSTDDALVSVANFNGAAQTVIAGHKGAVASAIEKLKEAGARRAVELPVSAPFHCALMAPVQSRLKEVLDAVEFKDGAYPVITNVDAAPNSDGARSRSLLIDQVVSSVRWTEIGQFLTDNDVDTFVEIGPGKVLTGMLKRQARGATFFTCMTPDDVSAIAEHFAKGQSS